MPDFEEIKKTTTGSKLLPIPAPALGNNPIPDNANIPKADALNPIRKENFVLGNQSKLAESSAPDPYADFPAVKDTNILKDEDIADFIVKDYSNLDSTEYIAFENIRDKELYPEVKNHYLTKLFPHTPRLDDIKKSKLNDSCFLEAIKLMINKDPSAIENMIRDNGDGTATVRLYNRKGEAEYYTVDISSAITKEAYDAYNKYKTYKKNNGDTTYKPFNRFMRKAQRSPYKFNSHAAHPVLWLEVLRKAYMYFRMKHVGDDGEYLKDQLERAKHIDLAYSIRGLQKKIYNDLNNPQAFLRIRGYLMQKIIESVYGSLKYDKKPTNTKRYKGLYDFMKKARKFYDPDGLKIKNEPERLEKINRKLDLALTRLHFKKLSAINQVELAILIFENTKKAEGMLKALIGPIKEAVGKKYLNEIGIMKILPDKLHKAYYGIEYGRQEVDTVLEFFLGKYGSFPKKEDTNILKDENVAGIVRGVDDKMDHRLIAFENIRNGDLYPEGTEVTDSCLTELFPHTPCLDDIRQGDFGDCYFLSAITSMINKDPSVIEKMIRDNGDGTATVRLYNRKGEAEYYTVDISSAITEKAYKRYSSWRRKSYNTNKSFNDFKSEEMRWDPTYQFTDYTSPVLWLEVLRKAYMYFKMKHVEDNNDWKKQLNYATSLGIYDSMWHLNYKIENDIYYKDQAFFKIRGYLMQEIIKNFYYSLKGEGGKVHNNPADYKKLYDAMIGARKFYAPKESKELNAAFVKSEKGKFKNFMRRFKRDNKQLQIIKNFMKSDLDSLSLDQRHELSKLISQDIPNAKGVLDNLIKPIEDVVGKKYLDKIGIMKMVPDPDELHKAYYLTANGGYTFQNFLELFVGDKAARHVDFPDVDNTYRLKDEEIAGFVSDVDDKTHKNIVFENIRNKELYPKGRKVKDDNLTELFPHKPCLDDIKQGNFGDCYFLSAITSMINKDPWAIKKMIRENTKDGTATVRLFDNSGKAEYYTVDISSAITKEAYNEYIKWREKDDNTNKSFDEFKSEEMKNKSPYIFNYNTYPVLWLEVLRKAYMYFRMRHVGYVNKGKDKLDFAKEVDLAEFIHNLNQKIYEDENNKQAFFKLRGKLMHIIMNNLYGSLYGINLPFNLEDYKELYEAMVKARKFYDPDELESGALKNVGAEKKKFQKFVNKCINGDPSSIKTVIECGLNRWTENFEQDLASLILQDSPKAKEVLDNLIKLIENAVGEKYLNEIGIMKIISDEPLHKAYYGIANSGWGDETFQKLFAEKGKYLSSKYEGQLKAYEKELEEKDKKFPKTGNKTHLKRKFPLSDGRDYDNRMLTIYNDIKDNLSKGTAMFIVFNTKRFTTSGTSSSDSKRKGLIRRHEYSILGVGEKVFPKIDGGSKTIKTIIIRNPHGWTGRQYKATKADGTLINDIFADPETMSQLTDFSSVHAVDTNTVYHNFSTPRTFRDLATGKDITGSGIFEMELSDFVYHVEWWHFGK